ncbi:MAG: hypothetical protein JNJ73_12600 [Hyphomonadaceae bacterium]|nr:hypothetical protein [Hyphomonadaceae bacterium]
MLRQTLATLALVFLSACTQTLATAPAQESPSSAAPAPSAPAPDLLGKMTGRWTLTGQIAGQNTVHDVEADWVLQESYVRITEVSRERDASGKPAYEAIVLIGWLKDHYVCFWFDNTEVASGDVTCRAPLTGDSIALEFRDGQGALIFTNTFAYRRAEDAWTWRMVGSENGQDALFGDVTLRRK